MGCSDDEWKVQRILLNALERMKDCDALASNGACARDLFGGLFGPYCGHSTAFG